MVTSEEVIRKIRKIIENRYLALTVSLLGSGSINPAELNLLEELGIDVTEKASSMAEAYYHNFLNEELSPIKPTSVEDMKAQQAAPGVKPTGREHTASEEHLDGTLKHLLENLKNNMASQIETLIRENNNKFKLDTMMNRDRDQETEDMLAEVSLNDLKDDLRGTMETANKRWEGIAPTEISNAISIGSVDRIVKDNEDKEPGEVYVYRIVVSDAALCKYCRRFYLDGDGSPKVYRLSTLLGNGSNYGKKASLWLPVALATHVRERCSQVLELRPGWEVTPGGRPKFIGLDAWDEYIVNKVVG